jgi:hypothetical protein
MSLAFGILASFTLFCFRENVCLRLITVHTMLVSDQDFRSCDMHVSMCHTVFARYFVLHAASSSLLLRCMLSPKSAHGLICQFSAGKPDRDRHSQSPIRRTNYGARFHARPHQLPTYHSARSSRIIYTDVSLPPCGFLLHIRITKSPTATQPRLQPTKPPSPPTNPPNTSMHAITLSYYAIIRQAHNCSRTRSRRG